MKISVILSTFNSPEALEKVVWGYYAQSYRRFELVVADDGSTEETRRALAELEGATRLRIRHVWHEDAGFRKCKILNKAITAAESEYLIFSDGDCIPRADFVAEHARLARRGHFLSGGMVRLPGRVSDRVRRSEIVSGEAFEARWLVAQGFFPSKKLLLLTSQPSLAEFYDRVTTTRPTWNGHNASGWKSDILKVNGFDERMEYGGLDRELGERMVNAGIRPRQIRHRAACIHLDHARDYVNREALERNRAIRQETRQKRRTWTEYGVTPGACRLSA